MAVDMDLNISWAHVSWDWVDGVAHGARCLWCRWICGWGLLAAVVADDGGTFTTQFFLMVLFANPADAFRLFNLTTSQAISAASGVGGEGSSIPQWLPLMSILIWLLRALGRASFAFRKAVP